MQLTFITNCYFFCSTSEEIKFPVLPPNWNVGDGITWRRQNSESIQIKTKGFVITLNINGIV
jgi:hypothetical protein